MFIIGDIFLDRKTLDFLRYFEVFTSSIQIVYIGKMVLFNKKQE